MQCREFREISDSYFSDELLVETNLQIHRHLENCPDCRADFAIRRELRTKLKAAVRNANEFRIDPIFFNKLEADLKEAALMKMPWKRQLFSPKFIVPVMATLLIALMLGIFYLSPGTNKDPSIVQGTVSNGLTEIAFMAAGDHIDCALEKLDHWEVMATQDYPEKAVFTERIVWPLRAKFSEDVEMLHAHDCIFDGKHFTHVILKNGSNVVSVFFDDTGAIPMAVESSVNPIRSEMKNGLQVASFQNNARAVFVVSNLPEAENINIARTLSDDFTHQGAAS